MPQAFAAPQEVRSDHETGTQVSKAANGKKRKFKDQLQQEHNDDIDDDENGERSVRKWRKGSKFSSKYRGVTYQKRDDRYVARAWIDKRIVHLGTFKSEREAARVVKAKYREVYGDAGNDFSSLSEESEDPLEVINTSEKANTKSKSSASSHQIPTLGLTAVSEPSESSNSHSVSDDPKEPT